MKFSSTDKIAETVSLIRNKNKFIDRNKCIITKIECWPVFKQDPDRGLCKVLHRVFNEHSDFFQDVKEVFIDNSI